MKLIVFLTLTLKEHIVERETFCYTFT